MTRARTIHTGGWGRAAIGAVIMAVLASGCAISRVSVSSTGTEGNSPSPTVVAVTDDGRYSLFLSSASNLVAGDTNGQADVFRHDEHTGATTRADVSASGAQAPSGAYPDSMTPDGRYVAFSTLDQLDPADTHAGWDGYVRDLVSNTTEWVTRPPVGGFPTTGGAGQLRMSADARFVSFTFAAGAFQKSGKVYRRDRTAGTTVALTDFGEFTDFKMSRDAKHYAVQTGCYPGVCEPVPLLVDTDGSAAAWPALQFPQCPFDAVTAMSSDGRYLVWYSSGVSPPSGTCLPQDSYLVDRTKGTATSLGLRNRGLFVSGVSRDARAVLYAADGGLFPGATTDRVRLYLRDRVNQTDTRPDLTVAGTEPDDDVRNGVLSDDGTYVAFVTASTNMVADDHNGWDDVYVRATGMPPSP